MTAGATRHAVGLAADLAHFRATHPPVRRVIDGVCWEYIVGGQGAATLMLLPGGPGRAETSFQYILALEKDYRVIAPSYPAAITRADTLVDGLRAMLAYEDACRAHVAGGSYSGLIAQHLVRLHPMAVATLALSDTGVPHRGRVKYLRAMRELLARLPTPLIRALLHLGTRAYVAETGTQSAFWRDYFHKLIGTLERADWLSRLDVWIDIDRQGAWGVSAPGAWSGRVLLLHVDHDPLFGAADRAALHARFPQAEALTLGVGRHAASLGRSDAYIAAMRNFWRNEG